MIIQDGNPKEKINNTKIVKVLCTYRLFFTTLRDNSIGN